MAPKRKTLDMTAEERIELQRKRNRDKQAALRARRAARLKELEEENAKLQQAGGSSGPRGAASATATAAAASSWSEGGKEYRGAIQRLSARLRQFGVLDAEIESLIRGPQPPSTASASHPPSWDAGLVNTGTGASTATSSSSSASSWTSPEVVISSAGPSSQPETPFPFSFLFSDSGGLRSDLDVRSDLSVGSTSVPPGLSYGALSASRLDAALPMPPQVHSMSSAALSPSSAGTDSGLGAADLVAVGSTPSDTAASPSSSANTGHTQSAEQLLAIEQGIQGLFDRLKKSSATKLLGGREGLFKKHRPVDTAAEKDIAATQLLILQLLGATSTQREAYDAHGQLSAYELALLQDEVFDPRIYWIPNPAFRVRLGVAHQKHGLDLTRLIGDMIELVMIRGDVWDWTGWAMPPSWLLNLPVDVQTGSLFFPGPLNGWTPRGTPLRPVPDYLTGSSIYDIILGLEKPGAREAGPFATTCTVEIVDTEMRAYA